MAKHMPWDQPWCEVGVPESAFWTEKRIRRADELVSDFLKSPFERVVRDNLSAEYKTCQDANGDKVPIIRVSNQHNEVKPIKYDNRHLTAAATEGAIRYARGVEK